MSTPTATGHATPTTCVVGSDDLVMPNRNTTTLWTPGTNVVGIAGDDVNNEAFKSCCDGPVHFAPPCALWCEMTPRPGILAELDSCWKSHGLTVDAQFGQLQMSFPSSTSAIPGATNVVSDYPVGYTTAAVTGVATGGVATGVASSYPASSLTSITGTVYATAVGSSTDLPTSMTTQTVAGHSSSTSTSTTAAATTAQTSIPVAAGNSVGVNFGVATAALLMVVKHLLF